MESGCEFPQGGQSGRRIANSEDTALRSGAGRLDTVNPTLSMNYPVVLVLDPR